MPRIDYRSLNVFSDDYQRFLERKNGRRGITLAGLFHELLEKTEPKPRTNDGKFAPKENQDG
jgi:hypothetical protein